MYLERIRAVKFFDGRITKFFTGFELKSTGKWFLLSALIGIVAGLGAIAFQLAIQVVVHFALGEITGYVPIETAGEKSIFEPPTTEFRPLLIIVMMLAGGAASGFLVYTFAPEAEGHGTDAAIDSFHNKHGYIRPQVPIIKTLASALTLGTGGSGGREGPIAQIGAGFGSFLATRLKLPAPIGGLCSPPVWGRALAPFSGAVGRGTVCRGNSLQHCRLGSGSASPVRRSINYCVQRLRALSAHGISVCARVR